MATEDRQESALDLGNNCEWIRALDANGKSIRISKADMVELIRANMPAETSYINGLMSSVNAALLSHMEIRTDENGAGILGVGVGFCFGHNKENPTLYCLFSFIRMPGEPACIRDKISGSLTIGNQNEQGTSIINGATNYISITFL